MSAHLKRSLKIALYCATIFLANCAKAQWLNGHQKTYVVGSKSLVKAGAFSNPNSLVKSAKTGKIFVADQNGLHRFANQVGKENILQAEKIFKNATGKPGKLNAAALHLDDKDNLWIADTENNRVIRLPNASTTDIFLPDLVLGQPNFTITSGGTRMAQLYKPSSLFVHNNQLWISDSGNNRVLRYDNVKELKSGATANMMLGTTNKTAAANAFASPEQIYVDFEGSLWVADTGNNRVLRFCSAGKAVGGTKADLVLGQDDFNMALDGTAQNKMTAPTGIYGDDGGRIYVACYADNRVLIFDRPISSGTDAETVIGQTNFDTQAQYTVKEAKALGGPIRVFFDDKLYVVESDFNRLSVFTPLSTAPVSLVNFTAVKLPGGGIRVGWETALETKSSYFETYKSSDGKHYQKIATVASKASQGISNKSLSYSYNQITTSTILAGVGLLSLLLLPAFKNNLLTSALLLVVIVGIASCTKDTLVSINGKTTYIKLVHVDLKGKATEIGFKTIK